MNNDQTYYYGEPGGDVAGPLPLRTIRNAQAAGRLSPEVMVSLSNMGPWQLLEKPRLAEIAAPGNPKLMACAACGQQIAKSATTCPHCGKSKTSLARIGLILLVVFILLQLFVIPVGFWHAVWFFINLPTPGK